MNPAESNPYVAYGQESVHLPRREASLVTDYRIYSYQLSRLHVGVTLRPLQGTVPRYHSPSTFHQITPTVVHTARLTRETRNPNRHHCAWDT